MGRRTVTYTIVSLERARAHLRAWVASHRDDDRPGMERYVVEVEAVLDRLDELEKRFKDPSRRDTR